MHKTRINQPFTIRVLILGYGESQLSSIDPIPAPEYYYDMSTVITSTAVFSSIPSSLLPAMGGNDLWFLMSKELNSKSTLWSFSLLVIPPSSPFSTGVSNKHTSPPCVSCVFLPHLVQLRLLHLPIIKVLPHRSLCSFLPFRVIIRVHHHPRANAELGRWIQLSSSPVGLFLNRNTRGN